MERGAAGRGDGGTGRRGIRSGTVREGRASGTVVGVGWWLQEATVGREGQTGGKVVLRDGVVDCDSRGGPLRRAGQGFVADHGVEGDVKVKVLEDQVRVLVAWS